MITSASSLSALFFAEMTDGIVTRQDLRPDDYFLTRPDQQAPDSPDDIQPTADEILSPEDQDRWTL